MTLQKADRPKHLGKGLASLMGPIIDDISVSQPPIPIMAVDAKAAVEPLDGAVRYIAVEAIRPNPYQVRTVWNEQGLADLAASIRANGVIQPVLLRKTGEGYQLIAGERRYRAAKLALLDAIPAIVRHANDAQMLELALVENIHRSDLNALERAKAYQNYLTTFSITQAEAAERLGEDRSVLANYLRLLDLPDEVKQMLADNQITMGHARAILSLPTDELRRKLANRAMAGRLSVRDVERLVKRYMTASENVSRPRVKAPHIADMEGRLASYLGTRVSIETRRGGHRGQILIEFYSLDEFDRIVERVGLPGADEV